MAVYMYTVKTPDGRQFIVTFDEGFSLMKQERILAALARGVHPAHTVEGEDALAVVQVTPGNDQELAI